MWDLKSIILFMCSILVVIIISVKTAGAGEPEKDWKTLYAEAGCNELSFLQKEICKTKVFQKTNWSESKYKLKGFFEKLNLN